MYFDKIEVRKVEEEKLGMTFEINSNQYTNKIHFYTLWNWPKVFFIVKYGGWVYEVRPLYNHWGIIWNPLSFLHISQCLHKYPTPVRKTCPFTHWFSMVHLLVLLTTNPLVLLSFHRQPLEQGYRSRIFLE